MVIIVEQRLPAGVAQRHALDESARPVVAVGSARFVLVNHRKIGFDRIQRFGDVIPNSSVSSDVITSRGVCLRHQRISFRLDQRFDRFVHAK